MAKASGSIDLKTYNKASQEATNYLQFDSQTGLTVGQEDLDSKVVISGEGVKLYDENGNVGTEIKSGEVVVGAEDTNQITLNEDGIVLSSVEDIETFKAGVAPDAVTLEYNEWLNTDGTLTTVLSKDPDSGSEIKVVTQFLPTLVAYIFTQGVAETQGGWLTYDGDKTFTHSPDPFGLITYTVTAHPPYLTFGTRDAEADIGVYSATFGRDLIASKEQTVFGKFNREDTNGDFSIIVGNGNSMTRANALALDNNGTLHLKGDVYVGSYANSTGGNKLVSASTQSGSGTVENVATGSTPRKNLATVSLPDEGVYMLVGLARFQTNANGRRGLCWGSTATGYYDHTFVVVPPVNGDITRIQSVGIVTVTSAPFNVYLNCYHTAGTQLDVDYYWRYLKLA